MSRAFMFGGQSSTAFKPTQKPAQQAATGISGHFSSQPAGASSGPAPPRSDTPVRISIRPETVNSALEDALFPATVVLRAIDDNTVMVNDSKVTFDPETASFKVTGHMLECSVAPVQRKKSYVVISQSGQSACQSGSTFSSPNPGTPVSKTAASPDLPLGLQSLQIRQVSTGSRVQAVSTPVQVHQSGFVDVVSTYLDSGFLLHGGLVAANSDFHQAVVCDRQICNTDWEMLNKRVFQGSKTRPALDL